ncbi:hypothetical protein KY329_04130, partial [Candidatus Woesearchaeota archaeon]|nr:hypothetical protein [Candidatus Woesearchaeota archaeon]
KYFLLILTNRRNYIPILALYFLSLPNTTAQQVGVYTGLGWLAGFLLEVPSGYVADKLGHKKALIFAKVSMLASTLAFILGDSLLYFILGSVFIAFGFAFTSGTAGAFLHNTLVGLRKENEYSKIDGKVKANASLISAVIILALPLLSKISLLMPIKAYLVFDVVGLLIAFALFTPKMEYNAEDVEGEKILTQLKRFRGTGFYWVSCFLGVIGASLLGLTAYKEPFVVSLGFPVVLVGAVMALSRVFWFIIGHNLKFLKKIGVHRLLFIEMLLFPGIIILVSRLQNPYVVGFLIALLFGYYFARNSFIDDHYLANFTIKKRYKATMI